MAWPFAGGLLKSLLARYAAEPYDPERRTFPYNVRTFSGVPIDEYLARGNDVTWACHRFFTQTVGQLPVRVMKEKADGTSERILRHPVINVLSWRPNPYLAPFQFKETLTGWALLWGNGYAEIERDSVGRVVALWPVHPERVEVRRDAETGLLFYRVDNDRAGQVDIDAMDMFHIRGFGDGPVGLSVIEHAAQTIGWAQATQIFGAAFFGNGLNHSLAIEGAGSLNEPGQKRMDAQLKARHGGPMRSNKPLYLDKNMKATKTSATPNEAQFIETMQWQVEAICRWFGAPPHKVMHLLRATFSNIEHQSIEVVVDAITPWALRFEEEANYKLFGQNRSGFYIKLDLKGLLRGDFKTRQEGLAIQRRNGVTTIDEWRDLEDLGQIGPENGGDIRIVEANMATIDGNGIHPAEKPKKNKSANDAGVTKALNREMPADVQDMIRRIEAMSHAA